METSLKIEVLKSVESANNLKMLKQARVIETWEFKNSENQHEQNTRNRYQKERILLTDDIESQKVSYLC